jgi:hypothetical protein
MGSLEDRLWAERNQQANEAKADRAAQIDRRLQRRAELQRSFDEELPVVMELLARADYPRARLVKRPDHSTFSMGLGTHQELQYVEVPGWTLWTDDKGVPTSLYSDGTIEYLEMLLSPGNESYAWAENVLQGLRDLRDSIIEETDP